MRLSVRLTDRWRGDPAWVGSEAYARFAPIITGIRASGVDARVALRALARVLEGLLNQIVVDAERRAMEENVRNLASFVAAQGATVREQDGDKAEKKAFNLLLSHLDPRQKRQMNTGTSFTVVAGNGRTYRISAHRSFNVEDMRTGVRYCGQIQDCPVYDQMLVQKLTLENDPDAFFNEANVMGSGVDNFNNLRPGGVHFVPDDIIRGDSCFGYTFPIQSVPNHRR